MVMTMPGLGDNLAPSRLSAWAFSLLLCLVAGRRPVYQLLPPIPLTLRRN